jgi:inner membrane protein involved in colicin E2 resistance
VSIAWAATLLVLAALVVCAAASFFRNVQTGLLLFVGLPAVVLLHALLGTVNTVLLVASFGILVALVRTISETLDQLRVATRPSRSRRRADRQRDTDRSRIAA